MPDFRERIESDENAFQQLLNVIPGFDGYREREIRRTADKLVRECLVEELDRTRKSLGKIVGQWAKAGRLEELDDIDRLSRLLGKARDNIRFADYGYTGFFDAVKINEEELDKLYEYDLGLRHQIDGCASAVEGLAAAGDDSQEKMTALESAIGELQELVDRREQVAASLVLDEE